MPKGTAIHPRLKIKHFIRGILAKLINNALFKTTQGAFILEAPFLYKKKATIVARRENYDKFNNTAC